MRHGKETDRRRARPKRQRERLLEALSSPKRGVTLFPACAVMTAFGVAGVGMAAGPAVAFAVLIIAVLAFVVGLKLLS